MKRNKIVSLICICGLLFSGCSAKEASDKAQEVKQTEDGPSGSEDAGEASTKSGEITEQEALTTALTHAGVKESDLTAKRIKKDLENGKEVYDVEFYADGKEYDYEISIADGSILKSDFEIEDDFGGQENGQSGKDEITEEKAKKIALAKVPGAKQIHIKRDIEDGRTVYEGEIFYENTEYEFEIDAATGKILSWEEDND